MRRSPATLLAQVPDAACASRAAPCAAVPAQPSACKVVTVLQQNMPVSDFEASWGGSCGTAAGRVRRKKPGSSAFLRGRVARWPHRGSRPAAHHLRARGCQPNCWPLHRSSLPPSSPSLLAPAGTVPHGLGLHLLAEQVTARPNPAPTPPQAQYCTDWDFISWLNPMVGPGSEFVRANATVCLKNGPIPAGLVTVQRELRECGRCRRRLAFGAPMLAQPPACRACGRRPVRHPAPLPGACFAAWRRRLTQPQAHCCPLMEMQARPTGWHRGTAPPNGSASWRLSAPTIACPPATPTPRCAA